ncbi:unnamed protein product [Spodoptera exigua]|nr:unnamed protein product [Spodoptera exigua]
MDIGKRAVVADALYFVNYYVFYVKAFLQAYNQFSQTIKVDLIFIPLSQT